jgi:hypothetical protein
MNKVLMIGLTILIAGIANANTNTLTCDDERDSSYQVKMDVSNGKIEIFKNGTWIDSENGRFEDCVLVDASLGAVLDSKICDFVRNGSKKSLGTITMREDGSNFYNMQLADRNFRGWCQ